MVQPHPFLVGRVSRVEFAEPVPDILRPVVTRIGIPGFVEALEKAWVITGCSGHGFKFGALLGLGVADAVTGARDAAALTAWAAGRAISASGL